MESLKYEAPASWKQQEAKEYDRLDYDAELALLEDWRETKDPLAFSTLYQSFKGALISLCNKLAEPWNEITSQFLMDNICPAAVLLALDKYDYDKSNGKRLLWWVYLVANTEILKYKKSKAAKQQRAVHSKADSLEAKREKGEDNIPKELAVSKTTPEDLAIQKDYRAKVRAVFNAMVATQLTGEERLVATNYYMTYTPKTMAEIADALDLTPQRIGQILMKIKGLLKKALETEEAATGAQKLSAKALLFQKFFRALECNDDNLERLEACGIKFLADGSINLRASTNNSFLVSFFRAKNGALVSGFHLMQSREAESLEDFFDEERTSLLLVAPGDRADLHTRTKKDSDLTQKEIVTAVRSAENIQRLVSLLGISTDEDGKWRVAAPARLFQKPWCAINGGNLKGGRKLVKLCGIKSTKQDGFKEFFEMVFGAERLNFIETKKGGGKYGEVLGKKTILEKMASKENQEELRKAGIIIEEETCHINGTISDFRDNTHFDLGIGKPVKGISLLEALGLDPNKQESLKALCKLLYPGHKIILWRFSNGLSMELKDPQKVLAEFKKRKSNLKTLREIAEEKDDGKLYVDLDPRTGIFTGKEFRIEAKKTCGIFALLNALQLGTGPRDIEELYQMVFGEENILVPEKPRYTVEEVATLLASNTENIEALLSKAHQLRGGRLYVNSQPRNGDFRGISFKIGEIECGIAKLLKLIGEKGQGKTNIRNLYKKVFPPNLILETKDLFALDITLELASHQENRDKLESRARKLADGRLSIGHLSIRNGDFRGEKFKLFNEELSIEGILNRTNYGAGQNALIHIYELAFGDGMIAEKITGQNKANITDILEDTPPEIDPKLAQAQGRISISGIVPLGN